jgi:iron complex outermembrane receptor protein
MIGKAALGSVSLIALIASPAIAQGQAMPAPTTGSTTAANASGDQPSTPVGDADRAGLQDIVVTATRQATNVQSTPIAITAVTAETLQVRGINSTADLSGTVPNATFRKSFGAFGPGVSAFIRGIGQSDTSLGSEPAVAYYVDDVYYPLLLGANFDLLDLDHIEVLRGPQGTLFGRNALAGAVNIVSRQPSLTDTSGYMQVSTGAYNRRDFRAGFNVPLTETLALSVSGLSKQRDGYTKLLDFRCQMVKNGTPELAGRLPYSNLINLQSNNNAVPDNCTVGRLGGEDVRAVRGSLFWKPAENVRLTLNGDYIRDRSENPADKLAAVVGRGNANVVAQSNYFGVPYDERFITNSIYSSYASYTDPVGSGVVIPAYAAGAAYPGSAASAASTFHNGFGPQRGGAIFPSNVRVNNWGVSAKLVVGLTDSIDFTAIAGYRKLTDVHAFDIDASPLVIEHTLLNIGEDYKNIEARLSGQSDFIDWVAGGFFFKGDGYTKAVTYSPQSAFLKYQNIVYDPKSAAVFANATVKPIDRVSVTLGGRYSDDRKGVDFSNVLDTNPTPNPARGDTIFQIRPRAKRFDWKAGLNFQATERVLLYASASTGARLPGYNARPQQPTQIESFDGDETLAYEFGVKADLFDRRLRINPTVFYTDYKTRITNVTGAEANLIVTGAPTGGSQTIIPLVGGPAGSTNCRTYNAATDGPANPAGGVGVLCIPRTYYVNTPGKVKGFEVEVEARPFDGLLLNGAVGYSHFSSPDLKVATRANDRIVGVPELNANVGIQYRAEAAAIGGAITPRLDWIYTGSIAMSATRNTFNQPAYSVFNSRLTYSNDEHDFTVSLGATNLFGKKYFRNYFVYQDIGFPNVNGQPGSPREWFLEIGKKF